MEAHHNLISENMDVRHVVVLFSADARRHQTQITMEQQANLMASRAVDGYNAFYAYEDTGTNDRP